MTTEKKSIRRHILNWSVFIIAFLVVYLRDNDTYTWFYYPNGIETKDNPIIQWWFKSKSDCFDWVNTMVKWNNKEDFECGTNCEYMTNFWVYKCDETFDSLL